MEWDWDSPVIKGKKMMGGLVIGRIVCSFYIEISRFDFGASGGLRTFRDGGPGQMSFGPEMTLTPPSY
jgi:hypothetical protein